ncbi:hypothetical protein Hanom_Chr09g00826461 [Helianthus anomalus]
MAESHWSNQTHAPNPSPTIPHGREFGFVFHVLTDVPQPTHTIPHGLKTCVLVITY